MCAVSTAAVMADEEADVDDDNMCPPGAQPSFSCRC